MTYDTRASVGGVSYVSDLRSLCRDDLGDLLIPQMTRVVYMVYRERGQVIVPSPAMPVSFSEHNLIGRYWLVF